MLVQVFKIEDHSVGSVFFGWYKNRRDNLPWFMTGFNNSCLLKQVCNLFRNDIIFFSTALSLQGGVFGKVKSQIECIAPTPFEESQCLR